MNSYSSYSLIILTLVFPELVEVIKQHTRLPLQQGIFGAQITQAHLDEALLNPSMRCLFKNNLDAGARVESTLHINGIDQQLQHFTEQLLNIDNRSNQLKSKIAEYKNAGKPTDKLIAAQEELKAGEKQAEENLAKDRTFEAQEITLLSRVNQLINKHAQEWEVYRRKYAEELIAALEANGLRLDLEKEEIRRCDNVAELLAMYDKVGLKYPVAKEEIQKYSDPILLEAKKAIFNSLSSQIEASGEEIITRYLSKVAPLLDRADKDGNELEARQHEELQQIYQQDAPIKKSLEVLDRAGKQIDKRIETIVKEANLTSISEQAAQKIKDEAEEITYRQSLREQGIEWTPTTPTKH